MLMELMILSSLFFFALPFEFGFVAADAGIYTMLGPMLKYKVKSLRKQRKNFQSRINLYLFRPFYTSIKVSRYLNSLIFREHPVVAVSLISLVLVSSIVLYVQGRAFAWLIGTIYRGGDVSLALRVFFVLLAVALLVALAVKKLTAAQRFYIREYFDPVIPIARNAMGMKSFTGVNNEILNGAEDGAYFIKFFVPQQVAFVSQLVNVFLGVGFLVAYTSALGTLILWFFIPMLLFLMLEFYLASSAAKVEEEAQAVFGECTETKKYFSMVDRFKGILLFDMADAMINHIKVRSGGVFSDLRRHNMSTFWLEVLSVAGLCYLAYFNIELALNSVAPVEIKIFLITASLSLIASSKRMVETFNEILVGAEKVDHVLDFERKDYESRKANVSADFEVTLPAAQLRIENLTVAYNEGENIIEDASVEFPAEGVVHALGPNGCGKSTMFAVMIGLKAVEPGKLFYGEIDLSTLTFKQKVKIFPQLLQENVQFRNSIRESHAWSSGHLNAHDCSASLIWKVLHMADLDKKIASSANGLDQALMAAKNKKGGREKEFSLSGGEMKRLNHSMFYAKLETRPALVSVFDEPYNNIDPEISEKLRNNIFAFPGLKIVATHDAKHYLRDDDLVLFFDKKSETGPPRSSLILDKHVNLLKLAAYRKYLNIKDS